MASLTILICFAKYKCKALCSICVFLYPNSLNVIYILRFSLVISNLIWHRLIYKWVSISYTSIKCNFLRVQFCCREMMARIRSIQIFNRSHWLCSSGAYDAVSKINCHLLNICYWILQWIRSRQLLWMTWINCLVNGQIVLHSST